MTRRGRSGQTAFALVGQVANLSYGASCPESVPSWQAVAGQAVPQYAMSR